MKVVFVLQILSYVRPLHSLCCNLDTSVWKLQRIHLPSKYDKFVWLKRTTLILKLPQCFCVIFRVQRVSCGVFSSVKCTSVGRHIIVDVLRFDYVNETISIGIRQFILASILCCDLLVMKTVHGDFGQVQNGKTEIYRSVKENFVFHHRD